MLILGCWCIAECVLPGFAFPLLSVHVVQTLYPSWAGQHGSLSPLLSFPILSTILSLPIRCLRVQTLVPLQSVWMVLLRTGN